MLTYIGRRLLIAVPTLIGVATLVFLLTHLQGGDIARVIAGPNATAADLDHIRHQLGLDKPVLVQYGIYMANLAHGDLGVSSRSGQPVLTEILNRLPYTVELAVISTAIAVPVGITLGLLAANRHDTWLDLAVSAFSVFGVSMPVYWLGLILIIIFAVDLKLLPAAGANQPLGFVLPSISLALFSIGFISRQTRAAMLEVMNLDFVRTARAKGARRTSVLVRHALRNALLPIITVIGLQFGTLLGGAILTETIYAWPGLGRLLTDSLFSRDLPTVQGVVLVFALALIFVNLATDLLYAYVDPRIRYD